MLLFISLQSAPTCTPACHPHVSTSKVCNPLIQLSASLRSSKQGFAAQRPGLHRHVSSMSGTPAQSPTAASRRSLGPRNPSSAGLGISPVRDVSLLEHGVNRPGGSHVGTPPKRDTSDRMVPSSLFNQFGFGQPRTPEIVQAGDPVLHEPAKDVAPQDVGSPGVEKVINDMVTAMRAAPGVGLAAPQLGVALNIIVLEDTEELMSFSDPAEVTEQERRPFGLLVVLNPKLRVVGTATARFFEGCLSVEGYRAIVERHLEVEVEGLSREGESLHIRAKGWQARILQFLSPHARSLCNGNEVRPRTVMGLSGTPEEEDEYIEAQVLDAVRMSPAKSQLFMSMRDGSEVEVIHVNPSAGRLLYHSSTPTIFLRMVSDHELLLPIVVGELAIGLLMKAFRHEHGGRPNHYEVMQNLVDVLQYEVRHVKVTQRVVDTYYARIYLGKPGEAESSLLSVDARPSDAINLAVRSNVPIFVSKSIVLNDAVKVAYESVVRGSKLSRGRGEVVKDEVLDSPSVEPDAVSEEMNLVKNLVAAVSDERYTDAARLRDLLAKLRLSGKRQLNKH